ncbi:MAG: transcriptional regulator [Sulfuricurvum sp. MLSB]|uniref:ATP-binding protein n=1 Tax=unclassified Sulfuricurvum TaxID=2632390 RepID=UPI0005074C80|nr:MULTISPECIES: ATP-binding protein [unclassified Sulfuricurvum]KFN40858.1 MAG: transcriptional regulator [Sulfuricurvum sp. MLSB]
MKLTAHENHDTEFKQSWRDEYIQWICGFANAKGGTIYIGVDDVGEIVGIDNAKKLLEDIPNKVRDLLGIIVDVQMDEAQGRQYLSIATEPYPYPVSYKGQYHYRTGSTKQELKGAALDRFLLEKQGKRWDGVPIPYIKRTDLDPSAIETFRQRAAKKERLDVDILNETDEELIDKLHLIDGEYLKRASVLLFAKDAERYITGAYIKIGYFKTDSDLRFHDEIHGNLFDQIEKTIDLLYTKYLKADITYEGIQRIETFPVSKLALREALINAVAHKDYGSGTPIQISVYDDKLMIWNAGDLPQGWSVETLKQKHPSKPFNPDIAHIFFLAGLIESWGRGIDKIISESVAYNRVEPTLRYDNGLWISFGFIPAADEAVETRGKTRGKTRENILETMRKTPSVTMEELAEAAGISTKGIEWQIQKLKSEGIIRRIGSAKGGHWEVTGE